MNSGASYYTITDSVQAKLEIKGSRFLALAYPVSSAAEVKTLLEKLNREYSDAAHLCYAYCIGTGSNQLRKAFDAGEPNFSAGQPILNAILSQTLADVLVVVVRWFGGTKLGKANLAKAYRQAAELALKKAEKVERPVTEKITLRFDSDKFNLVNSLLQRYKAELVEKNFNTRCRIMARVPLSNLPAVKERLLEVTAGKIKFE